MERSASYWFIENKDIEMIKSSFFGRGTVTRYFCTTSFEAAPEKLLKNFKGFGWLRIKMKTGTSLELCCVPVTVPYCCAISEAKDVSNVKHALL